MIRKGDYYEKLEAVFNVIHWNRLVIDSDKRQYISDVRVLWKSTSKELAFGAQATAVGPAPQATAGLPATGGTTVIWYANPLVWLVFVVIVLAIIAIVAIANRPREIP